MAVIVSKRGCVVTPVELRRLGLGNVHRRAGDLAKAKEHLATAAAMYRELDMRFWLHKAETSAIER
jgi:hypothetical protein